MPINMPARQSRSSHKRKSRTTAERDEIGTHVFATFRENQQLAGKRRL
jgi:hypothetical protein